MDVELSQPAMGTDRPSKTVVAGQVVGLIVVLGAGAVAALLGVRAPIALSGLLEAAAAIHLRSESKTGASLVYVEIREQYTDMRPIWDNLRRKVDDVTGRLPEGVVGPIVNDEFGDVFGTILMITGDGYTTAQADLFRQHATATRLGDLCNIQHIAHDQV